MLLDEGRIVDEGTHTDLLLTSERYRAVLAAAEAAEDRAADAKRSKKKRWRLAMWSMAGVDEADKLDRKKAAKVLRRSLGMLRPVPAPDRRRRACSITLWTGTVLAGPFLVKYGIDQGHREARRARRSIAPWLAYVVVAIVAYVVYRLQIMLVGRIGEGFLRDLRIRVFDHLQQLSMPFYDREKAGVIVSRMTSDVDALAELVQMGLLMFLGNTLLLVFSVDRAGDRVVAAAARVPGRAAVRDPQQHQVPARLQQGLPAGPRPHRHDVVVAARGTVRRARDPGLRPGGRAGTPVHVDEP